MLSAAEYSSEGGDLREFTAGNHNLMKFDDIWMVQILEKLDLSEGCNRKLISFFVMEMNKNQI